MSRKTIFEAVSSPCLVRRRHALSLQPRLTTRLVIQTRLHQQVLLLHARLDPAAGIKHAVDADICVSSSPRLSLARPGLLLGSGFLICPPRERFQESKLGRDKFVAALVELVQMPSVWQYRCVDVG